MSARPAAAILAPAFLVLSACVGGVDALPTATSVRGDRLELVSISPESGSKVRAGQAVTFTATVRYTLAADVGYVSMVVLNEGGQSLPGSSEQSNLVGRGSATMTLSDSATVPQAGVRQVQVHVFMSQPSYADLSVTVKYAVD